MANLEEVKSGLIAGKSFKRPLDDDNGWEYLAPSRYQEFEHTVVGESNGGWGGCAELPVSTLDSGRWASIGWIEDDA